MSRVQLALRVSDLDESITFYSTLFGAEPVKRRPGYASFAVTEPPLKLVLLKSSLEAPTVLDHLGVEVETTDEVTDATARLSGLGLFTEVEDDVTCCYAHQDKVWVHGPGDEPWEVYTVTGDSSDYGTDGVTTAMGTCATSQDRADCCATTEPAPVLASLPSSDGAVVACSLDDVDRQERARRWQELLAAVTTRVAISDGVQLTFDWARVRLDQLTELTEAESRCCSFFDMTLRFGPPLRLDVRAPADALALVHELFGEPPA